MFFSICCISYWFKFFKRFFTDVFSINFLLYVLWYLSFCMSCKQMSDVKCVQFLIELTLVSVKQEKDKFCSVLHHYM